MFLTVAVPNQSLYRFPNPRHTGGPQAERDANCAPGLPAVQGTVWRSRAAHAGQAWRGQDLCQVWPAMAKHQEPEHQEPGGSSSCWTPGVLQCHCRDFQQVCRGWGHHGMVRIQQPNKDHKLGWVDDLFRLGTLRLNVKKVLHNSDSAGNFLYGITKEQRNTQTNTQNTLEPSKVVSTLWFFFYVFQPITPIAPLIFHPSILLWP